MRELPEHEVRRLPKSLLRLILIDPELAGHPVRGIAERMLFGGPPRTRSQIQPFRRAASPETYFRRETSLRPGTYFRPNAYIQIPARAPSPSGRQGQDRAIELGRDPPDGGEGCPRLRIVEGEAPSRLETPRAAGASCPGCRLRGCGLSADRPFPSFRTLVGARTSNVPVGFWSYVRDIAEGSPGGREGHVLVPREDRRHRQIALAAAAVSRTVQAPSPVRACVALDA